MLSSALPSCSAPEVSLLILFAHPTHLSSPKLLPRWSSHSPISSKPSGLLRVSHCECLTVVLCKTRSCCSALYGCRCPAGMWHILLVIPNVCGGRGISLPAVLLPVPHRWEQRSPFPPVPVWQDRANPFQAGDFCLEEGTQQLLVPFSLTCLEKYEENKSKCSGWPALLWRGMLCASGAVMGGACQLRWREDTEKFVICPQSKGSSQGTGTCSGCRTMSTVCPVGPRCLCRVG